MYQNRDRDDDESTVVGVQFNRSDITASSEAVGEKLGAAVRALTEARDSVRIFRRLLNSTDETMPGLEMHPMHFIAATGMLNGMLDELKVYQEVADLKPKTEAAA